MKQYHSEDNRSAIASFEDKLWSLWFAQAIEGLWIFQSIIIGASLSFPLSSARIPDFADVVRSHQVPKHKNVGPFAETGARQDIPSVPLETDPERVVEAKWRLSLGSNFKIHNMR
ncbi:hypothetical protein LENED_010287 [Lentinula edodes]|uniref:Uncharacterized protein n=1 Tax=Lentinula edodes TaxID=5353 RepID=A0A1Q3EM09_LENED|nr:hypothetical protein LENED_010287 [Lentinula edodes]